MRYDGLTRFLFRLITSLPLLASAAAALLCARRLLHYFQLESYQFYGYFKTVARQWKKAVLPSALLGALFFGIYFLAYSADHAAEPFRPLRLLAIYLPAAAVIVLIGYLVAARQRKAKEKKPFVMTARMKRLYIILGVVAVALCLVSPLFVMALPLLVALAALIALPLEKGIQRMYMRDAQRKLDAQKDLIRIGITGSYGKTSVKVILNTLLSQKYNVLSTPASFNTPMGLTRVIRERLEPAHQVFLAEMGARHRKDIKELTDFIHPTIGVLVSVGPQHLDTFKTMENIIDTKYDLIRALPADGFAAFSDDGGVCADLYAKTTHVPKAIVNRKGGDVWAEDMRVSDQGSDFTLCFADGSRVPCRTRLLGAHNIGNILLCCAVARHLPVQYPAAARYQPASACGAPSAAAAQRGRRYDHRRCVQQQSPRSQGRAGCAFPFPRPAHHRNPWHGGAGCAGGVLQPRVWLSDGRQRRRVRADWQKAHPAHSGWSARRGLQYGQRACVCKPFRGYNLASGLYASGRLCAL